MTIENLTEAILSDELKARKDLLAEIYPIVEEAAKNTGRLNRLNSKVADYIDNNSSVLMTNTVGLKLYFNAAMDDILFTTLGIDKAKIANAISHNETFNAIKEDLKRQSHFLFAIPFLMLIRYLLLENRVRDARYFYMFLFYKPYSSSINNTFKYLNVDQMTYTIEHMNNRFKIKSLGTVSACIEDISNISFDNYANTIIDATDKGLYDVYVSGVQTRIKGFISKIFGEYLKNAGKYKPYETENRGDDEDKPFYMLSNISSDISNIANKVANRIVFNPIDQSILEQINRYKAGPKFGIPGVSIVKVEDILVGLIEKKYNALPALFVSMLSAFIVDNGNKTEDVGTPMFLKFALENVYSVNNVKKPNVIRAKEQLKSLIESVSAYFVGLGKTQQAYVQKAIYIYFTLSIMRH